METSSSAPSSPTATRTSEREQPITATHEAQPTTSTHEALATQTSDIVAQVIADIDVATEEETVGDEGRKSADQTKVNPFFFFIFEDICVDMSKYSLYLLRNGKF